MYYNFYQTLLITEYVIHTYYCYKFSKIQSVHLSFKNAVQLLKYSKDMINCKNDFHTD